MDIKSRIICFDCGVREVPWYLKPVEWFNPTSVVAMAMIPAFQQIKCGKCGEKLYIMSEEEAKEEFEAG